MECIVCNKEISVTGDGNKTKWVEIVEAESVDMGNHSTVFRPTKKIVCKECYCKNISGRLSR